MEFQIIPYIGASRLLFGMTVAEAEACIGEAKSVFHTMRFAGESREYESTTLGFDMNGRLVHIGFSERDKVRLTFQDVDIFGSPSALDDLIRLDGEPFTFVGFIYLLRLGLQLGGFHKQADEGKTVSMFEKGRYDLKLTKFKPFNSDSP